MNIALMAGGGAATATGAILAKDKKALLPSGNTSAPKEKSWIEKTAPWTLGLSGVTSAIVSAYRKFGR